MNKSNCNFMINQCSKFFSTLYLSGWFGGSRISDLILQDKLVDVELRNCNPKSINKNVGFDYPGLLDKRIGFTLQILFHDEETDIFDIEIVFITKSGAEVCVRLGELIDDRLAVSRSYEINDKFRNMISPKKGLFKKKKTKMLDIGGRDRSGLDRSKLFPEIDVVVLDILKGDNVDVVGDAHELSKYFGKESFDAIHSICVFEHLLQPWKVAIEMNKVLKKNGVALIFTHQTIGMHDIPWDYFRFSDSSWDAIFNKYTGFEILDRALDFEQFIIPFVLRPGKEDAEKAAGFEGSTVLIRKISECELAWDVPCKEIITSSYPDTPEVNRLGGKDML